MTPKQSLMDLFSLSEEFATQLLEAGEVQTIEAGEILEVQGQELENFLFVFSGLISVYRQNFDGAERFAGFIPPGFMYSESAILNQTKLYGRYHIQETMTALVLPISTVLELYKNSLEFNKLTAQHLSQKLLFTSRILFISHERNSNRKVGLALDSLYRVTNKRSIPISVEDLAGMLGMSRNTVSKTLDYWEEQGAITNSKARVTFNSTEPFSSITDGMVF
ncbi:Crp/Fnr family transcriptional regulator [Vibrio harveyi]|nr:Crp/Fnr family transcriptional regulator [Vibrio harveyi]